MKIEIENIFERPNLSNKLKKDILELINQLEPTHYADFFGKARTVLPKSKDTTLRIDLQGSFTRNKVDFSNIQVQSQKDTYSTVILKQTSIDSTIGITDLKSALIASLEDSKKRLILDDDDDKSIIVQS